MMNMQKTYFRIGKGPMHLVFALIFSSAFLLMLLWGINPALSSAAPGATIRYVDGAEGNDDGNCANPAVPCATIGYALAQAEDGDEIRVAEGVIRKR